MVRNRKIAVTTTPRFEGFEIQAYLGVVSAHVVAGTGLFSDVFASFSDIFGGRSQSYQKQLASINEEVIELLRKKASTLGGNSIVGLRIDHDEIAGGGKSMFMVTAIGTAVVAQPLQQARGVGVQQVTALSADDLNTLVHRQQLIEAAKDKTMELGNATWEFLYANQVHEVAPAILATVEVAKMNRYAFPEDFIDRSKAYFHNLRDEEVREHLYAVLIDGEWAMRNYALGLLTEMNLLDLKQAREMLRSDDFRTQKNALSVLLMNSATFSVVDADKMDALREQVEISFGKRGRVIEVDQMFSSKTKQRWECECGETSNIEEQYCSKCSHDIYGFRQDETRPEQVVDILARKAAVLRRQFGNSVADVNVAQADTG